MSRVLWVLSGGNGAGKSTFYEEFLKTKGVAFINADEIAKDAFSKEPEKYSYQAANIAEDMREQLLEQGRSFCFETVFSHPSKIDFIAKAKALGYVINLVFIHLEHSDINLMRVSSRVDEGGHSVPEDKIISRIPRALVNVAIAAQLSDYFLVLDNSRLDRPFKKILTIKNNQTTCYFDPMPDWALDFLG